MLLPLRSVGPEPAMINTTGPFGPLSESVSVPPISPLSVVSLMGLSLKVVSRDCAMVSCHVMQNRRKESTLIFIIKKVIRESFIEMFYRIAVDIMIYRADENILSSADDGKNYKCAYKRKCNSHNRMY